MKNKFILILVALCIAFTAMIVVACPAEVVVPGPETGVYYYDALGEDNLLSLYEANKFTLKTKTEIKSGVYAINDSALSFTYSGEKEPSLTATYNAVDRTVTFTQGNVAKVYVERIYHDVEFVTGDGVVTQKVLNGKTVVKPADPIREGYDFMGWYADEALKNPYLFQGSPVIAGAKIYARWEKKSAQDEFVIDFDLGYDGAMGSVLTRNGKLTDMPIPEKRSGYSFVGWWISDYETRDMLTRKYESGDEFKASTTLFAVWETDSDKALTVSVDAEGISWIAESGVVKLDVDGPNGFVNISEDVNGIAKNID